MDKATFLELLDKHLGGTLSSAERNLFEQAKKDNPDFQNEYDMTVKIQKGVTLYNRQTLLNEINQIREDYNNEQPTEKKRTPLIRRIIPYALAASIALLIGFFLLNPPSDPKLLYTSTMDIRILPKEGNIGGGAKKSRQVQFYHHPKAQYFTEDDTTIKIYLTDKTWINENIKLEKVGSNTLKLKNHPDKQGQSLTVPLQSK